MGDGLEALLEAHTAAQQSGASVLLLTGAQSTQYVE